MKKGYARDADSRQRSAWVLAHRDWVCGAWRRVALVFVREDRRLANRKPSFGFISMQLVFLWRCSPCREGAGYELAPKGVSIGRLSQVGIANESDQVT